jgi:hypothetical protein
VTYRNQSGVTVFTVISDVFPMLGIVLSKREQPFDSYLVTVLLPTIVTCNFYKYQDHVCKLKERSAYLLATVDELIPESSPS